MKSLTDQQRRVLTFVDSFSRENGFPPSLREIGDAVGVQSANAVRGHLAALEKKGYISRVPDQARSIRVLTAPLSKKSRLRRRLHRLVRTDEGVVHRVVYALAWATRGCTPLPSDADRAGIVRALEQEAAQRGWELQRAHVAGNHVRVVLTVWPNHSAERVARRLKDAATAGAGLRRVPGGGLWARGYAVTTDVDAMDELVAELLRTEGRSDE